MPVVEPPQMRDTFAAAKADDARAHAIVQRYARFVAFRSVKARNYRMFAEMLVSTFIVDLPHPL